VAHTTLGERFRGKHTSRKSACESHQLITAAEEKVLLEWMDLSAIQGWPYDRQDVRAVFDLCAKTPGMTRAAYHPLLLSLLILYWLVHLFNLFLILHNPLLTYYTNYLPYTTIFLTLEAVSECKYFDGNLRSRPAVTTEWL
jgi:hypothetical protein